jgi:hypothetical protein
MVGREDQRTWGETEKDAAELGCGVLADFDLNPGASSGLGRLEKRGCDFRIDVLLTTICTDIGWHAFENQRGSVLLQSHRGLSRLCFALLANYTLHDVFLLLKSASHSERLG